METFDRRRFVFVPVGLQEADGAGVRKGDVVGFSPLRCLDEAFPIQIPTFQSSHVPNNLPEVFTAL